MKQQHRFCSLLLTCLMAVGISAQGYKDVTSYIQNANQAASAGWTYTRQTTGGETKTWSAINKLNSGSYDTEIYAGDQLGYTTFSASQTITLPKGTYHLIGKAFKRDVPSVVLYAEIGGKRQTVEVVNVTWQFSSTTPTDKSPSSMDAAAKAFNGNMYLNDLAFTIDADDTEVTIGYAGEFTAAKQWFIFGAMNLYQVQDEVSTSYPVDITPSLNRARDSYSGLTGRYANADIYIHEKYSSSNFSAGDLVSQTFTGLENGIYEVVINANLSKANNVGSLPATNPYVYAANITADVTAKEQSSVSTVGEYTLSRVPVTDGTMKVGLCNQATGGNWALFNVKSVRYCGVDLTALVESYESLLATAKALQAEPMQAGVKTALGEAVTEAETDMNTGSQTWLETAISALSTAVSNAQTSNALYTGAILVAVNGMKAQSSSETVKTAVQAKYDAGEYDTAADVYAYYQPLALAALSTEAGTDYTSALINPSFELGNTDGWTIEKQGNDTGVHHTNNATYEFSGTDGDYLYNTWTTNISTLDISQAVTGLPNGYYTLSGVVAGFGDGAPITMTAGGKNTSVSPTNSDVQAEAKVGHTLTIEDIFVTDGTLTFKLTNTGKGQTLLKCDNFHLTLTKLYEAQGSYTDIAYVLNVENDEVARYLANTTYTEGTATVIGNYNTDAAARNDQPNALTIELPAQDTDATLSLCLSSDYADAQTFTVAAGSIAYDVANLLPQQTYYYKVEAGGEVVANGTIATTGRLRMIRAEGIANMRDLGGWQTAEGNRLRYGKLFRGSELRGGKVYTATDADLTMLKESLNIGAEVDLREDADFASGTMNTSAVDGATYYYANLSRWSEDALNLDAAKFKAGFGLVLAALKAGKAAYFHCIYGADRTGCFAFLLEGLLGLPVDQLYKDYELTSFSTAGQRAKDGIDHKIQYIKNLPGTTLQEKFYNYWHGAVGVSESDLRDFINLMVEGESTITTADLADLPAKAVEDGEYYIYLPTYEQFLGRGLSWGTRAVPDRYGVPATVQTNGVGVTTFKYLDNSLYLGSDAYADKSAYYNTVSWTLEQYEGHLVMKSHSGKYLNIYDDGNGVRARVETANASEATPIELKTKDEQLALVAAAQQANVLAAAGAAGITAADMDAFTAELTAHYTAVPKAATIKSATTGSKTDWVLSEPNNHGETANYGNAYNVGNYGGEFYQKNASVSQTVSVPHAGLYKLTLNAFYRQGTNADCYAIGQKGYELSNAYVSVNDTYFAQIPSWYSDCAGSANPDNTDQAKVLMDAGKYAVEVWAYIGESKQATITINVPNFTSRGWCIFNNFALTAYAKEVTISEADTEAPAAEDYANVTLTRTLQPAIWNTMSLPFDLSSAQLAASPLAAATVYAFSESDDTSIAFTEADAIEAGKPYLVKLPDEAEAISNPTFAGVTVVATEGETVGSEGNVQFVGQTYNRPLTDVADVCYLATDGKVKQLSAGGSIKGLRAYFIVPDVATDVKLFFNKTEDSIEEIADRSIQGGEWYDLSGRRVAGANKPAVLPKGMYIMSGKKFIVK